MRLTAQRVLRRAVVVTLAVETDVSSWGGVAQLVFVCLFYFILRLASALPVLGEAKGAHTWPTWRREEGPRQLAVSGELFDLSDDVDESTDRWRDPVEAEHSGDKDRVKKKT